MKGVNPRVYDHLPPFIRSVALLWATEVLLRAKQDTAVVYLLPPPLGTPLTLHRVCASIDVTTPFEASLP